MWVTGAKTSRKFRVTPLSEEMAIDMGADLLGEAFIFSVAAGESTFWSESPIKWGEGVN